MIDQTDDAQNMIDNYNDDIEISAKSQYPCLLPIQSGTLIDIENRPEIKSALIEFSKVQNLWVTESVTEKISDI